MKLTLVTLAGICIVAIVPSAQAQRSPCALALGTVRTDSAALAFENAWADAGKPSRHRKP